MEWEGNTRSHWIETNMNGEKVKTVNSDYILKRLMVEKRCMRCSCNEKTIKS